MHIDRINFLDLHFDQLSFSEIVSWLQAATSVSRYQYIVTPNVDHVVRVHQEPALRGLYANADLCVCDSRVLKLLARLRGITLPLVPGSDLSEALFSKIIVPGDTVAIVGADRACVRQLEENFPKSRFVHLEPPMDLRRNAAARSAAAQFIAKSGARFAFIAVGSPQQEMIANEVRQHSDATGIGLCIGAGLDFITGKQKRAPKLVQKLGLEWAHRLLSNPRRLWRRYMVDGLRIFPIWFRWRRRRAGSIWIAGVIALGVIAIAALSLGWLRGEHPARSSVDLWLPPASQQSAAAVQSLPPPNLLKPVSPEEAAKENSERPFVSRRDSPASRFLLRTDSDDRTRALTCLAQAIYYEAAGEGTEGGRAVAQVVLNRLRHPGFPSTVCGVVYEGADRPSGCQFSFTCDGSMRRIPVPSLWSRSRKIAEDALKGRVFAPVGHATHYHADYVLPYWTDSLDKSVQVGRHIFYRLRSTFGEPRAFSQHYGGAEPSVREPGATIATPATPEGQQLADKLIDGANQGTEQSAKTPPSRPVIPLVIDETPSTLLADGGNEALKQSKRKLSSDCSISAESKMGPLKTTDMRSQLSHPSC